MPAINSQLNINSALYQACITAKHNQVKDFRNKIGHFVIAVLPGYTNAALVSTAELVSSVVGLIFNTAFVGLTLGRWSLAKEKFSQNCEDAHAELKSLVLSLFGLVCFNYIPTKTIDKAITAEVKKSYSNELIESEQNLNTITSKIKTLKNDITIQAEEEQKTASSDLGQGEEESEVTESQKLKDMRADLKGLEKTKTKIEQEVEKLEEQEKSLEGILKKLNGIKNNPSTSK